MSLSDLMEDGLWEHPCVEVSGDDVTSVHHMSSREQKDETIVGSKVEMIDSETLVNGMNSSVYLRFGAEEA